jgi:hypothetical protein
MLTAYVKSGQRKCTQRNGVENSVEDSVRAKVMLHEAGVKVVTKAMLGPRRVDLRAPQAVPVRIRTIHGRIRKTDLSVEFFVGPILAVSPS